MNRLVVNFLGAPNSGKSTAAASLYAALKKKNHDVGLVTEYARTAVVEQNAAALKDQFYIWATQAHHVFCSWEHYTLTVTDSPILLGAIYNDESTALLDVILEQHHRYDNFNIFIPLDEGRPYSMVGRIHDLEQSRVINDQIMGLLETYDLPWLNYAEYTEDEIIELIVAALE